VRALRGLEDHHSSTSAQDQGARRARMARLTTRRRVLRGRWGRSRWGGSLEGGREEFREVWFSCSCNACLKPLRSPHALRVPEYRLALALYLHMLPFLWKHSALYTSRQRNPTRTQPIYRDSKRVWHLRRLSKGCKNSLNQTSRNSPRPPSSDPPHRERPTVLG